MRSTLRGRVKVATEPSGEPVTLAEAKDHLRVTDTAQDTYITNLIKSARVLVENFLGRKLITQQLELWIDNAPGREDFWNGIIEAPRSAIQTSRREIELPWLPLQSVESVSSFGDDDAETTFAASNYLVDDVDPDRWGRVILKRSAVWPVNLRPALAIRVQYTVGYGAAADVPFQIRQGLLQVIGAMFKFRGDCPEGEDLLVKAGAFDVLCQFRVLRVG